MNVAGEIECGIKGDAQKAEPEEKRPLKMAKLPKLKITLFMEYLKPFKSED